MKQSFSWQCLQCVLIQRLGKLLKCGTATGTLRVLQELSWPLNPPPQLPGAVLFEVLNVSASFWNSAIPCKKKELPWSWAGGGGAGKVQHQFQQILGFTSLIYF